MAKITIYDAVSPTVAKIIFEGLCACKADDYQDIHYHVTMAWRNCKAMPVQAGTDLSKVTPQLLKLHLAAITVSAMELANIGFSAKHTPLTPEERERNRQLDKPGYQEERITWVDEHIADYHVHVARTAQSH